MDIKNIYKQLTNVDIDFQRLLWDDRGRGYYGEFLVFCHLYKNIPGNCKILMNLNIPVEDGKTTEIDLVLIHETGIYVFEVKHYKGTIYGDDESKIWTQYFRTVNNSTFINPVLQNAYHIRALKNIFKDAAIKSLVVFTNSNCDIRVNNSNTDINICKLDDLDEFLKYDFKNSEIKYTRDEINSIFNELSKYSQMQEQILYDGKEESFISWLQPTIQALDEERKNLNNQKLHNRRNTIIRIIVNAIFIISSIFFITNYTNQIKSDFNNELKIAEQNYNSELRKAKWEYNTELEKFKQNFKHIDEIDNISIATLNQDFAVSNISLSKYSDNSVTFTAKISRKTDSYGMALTEDSKYIVMTSDGKVYEYDVFGKHLSYSRINNMIGKGIRDSGNLAKIQFSDVYKDEITYIKITKIETFELNSSRTIIKRDLELELYSK